MEFLNDLVIKLKDIPRNPQVTAIIQEIEMILSQPEYEQILPFEVLRQKLPKLLASLDHLEIIPGKYLEIIKLLDDLINENYLPTIKEKIRRFERIIQYGLADTNDIFSLMEKASKLGDENSSYLLALLYLGNLESCVYFDVPTDIALGMTYLSLSLEQGEVKAGYLLSDIYQHKEYSGLVKLERIAKEVPLDLKAAQTSLLLSQMSASESYHKANSAYLLAELYVTYDFLLPPALRTNRIIELYELASNGTVGWSIPEAIAKYGTLFLTGNEALKLAPNLEKADKIFNLVKEHDYSLIYREIGRATPSSENLCRYLYWLFKDASHVERSFENDERYLNNARFAIGRLSCLLTDGYSAPYYLGGEKDGTLHATCNKELALQCNRLLSINRPVTKAELEKVMLETYKHFSLDCPFDHTFATEDRTRELMFKIPNPANPSSLVTIITDDGSPKPNPCFFFSGRTFRKDMDHTSSPAVAKVGP